MPLHNADILDATLGMLVSIIIAWVIVKLLIRFVEWRMRVDEQKIEKYWWENYPPLGAVNRRTLEKRRSEPWDC
jgi:hypothetical protein